MQQQDFSCKQCKQPLHLSNTLLTGDQSELLRKPGFRIMTSPQLNKAKLAKKNSANDGKQLPSAERSLSSSVASGLSGAGPRRKNSPAPEAFVVLPRQQEDNTKEMMGGVGGANKMIAGEGATRSGNLSEAPRTGKDDMAEDRSSLSQQLKVTARLFDLMSVDSDIEHPLCHDCTETLIEGMTTQLAELVEEKECYEGYLQQSPTETASAEELQKEIDELQRKEIEAFDKMGRVEKQRLEAQEELRVLRDEEQRLDSLEEAYWEDLHDFQRQLQLFRDERDSVSLKYDHDAKLLLKLQTTNVYNDAFRIGHDGHFGTINGFRLGRLPNTPVEWTEINAAWGQTLLLLYTIANRLSFKFQTYRLVPLGSFSRIEKTDNDGAVYELYASGDLNIGRLFLNRRFDSAMVAFLACLKQLGDFAEAENGDLTLPYRINNDKIKEISIKLHFNDYESWTKALRYTLTNVKWLLAFASSRPASHRLSQEHEEASV